MLLCKLLRFASKLPLKRAPQLQKVLKINLPRRFCSESPASFGGVDLQKICDGDKLLEKHLKVVILEVDVLRQEGQLIPDEITTAEWQELMSLPTRPSRIRYLTFLFKNQKRKENQKNRIEQRKLEREIAKQTDVTDHIRYGFGGNTIFLRVYDSTMDTYLNKNLMNAAIYSQHIVFDCSYDDYMTKIESKNCARQICLLFSQNRSHPQPFHIQLCNADPQASTIQFLNRYIPTMYNKDFPMFFTEKSYLDLYPKEKLVYLTPHCRNDLTEWNHDDVYIIGAMVDKSNPKPISLAKAKEHGLRMAKLPLERHLLWGTGASKNLTLNQMTSILLDKRHTGDWLKAFQHIPRRKIVTLEDLNNKSDQKLIQNHPSVAERAVKTEKEVLLSNDILKNVKSKKFDFSKLYD